MLCCSTHETLEFDIPFEMKNVLMIEMAVEVAIEVELAWMTEKSKMEGKKVVEKEIVQKGEVEAVVVGKIKVAVVLVMMAKVVEEEETLEVMEANPLEEEASHQKCL